MTTKHQILIIDFTGVPVLGVSSSLALEKMILDDLQQSRPVFVVGATGEDPQAAVGISIDCRPATPATDRPGDVAGDEQIDEGVEDDERHH